VGPDQFLYDDYPTPEPSQFQPFSIDIDIGETPITTTPYSELIERLDNIELLNLHHTIEARVDVEPFTKLYRSFPLRPL